MSVEGASTVGKQSIIARVVCSAEDLGLAKTQL